MGIITACAALSPFTVSRFSAGGQSIRMKSYSASIVGERLLEPHFAMLDVDQLDFGAGEFAIGRYQIVARRFRTHAHFA